MPSKKFISKVIEQINVAESIHEAIKIGTDIGVKMNATEPCVCGHGKPMHCISISQGGDGHFHENDPCNYKCGCLSYRCP